LKKYIVPLSICISLAMLLIIGFDLAKSFKHHTKEKPVVYMIVKSSKPSEGFEFWEIVKMGADVAATELDVDVVFTGPEDETQVEEQIRLIRDAIKQKPTAIVLAATDYKKLREVGQEVISNGITLITIDSQVDVDTDHSFIGTDNIGASKTIAKELAGMIDNKGRVAVMSYVYGTSTSIEREAGFREVLKEYPDIDVIEETWYSNGSIDIAYEKTKEILKKYPDTKAIFGANEICIVGIGRAIEEFGLKDEVVVVGFDSNEEIVSRIESGIIDKIVVQKPFNMGYQGIKEAIKIANREKKPEIIDTGAVLIDKSNLYTPENQKLLFSFENK